MSSYNLPSITELSSLSQEDQTNLLNNLFEKCETLTTFLVPKLFTPSANYDSYKDLIEESRAYLLKLVDLVNSDPSNFEEKTKLDKIISAHPRLGPQKPSVSSSGSPGLSQHSSAEQKSLASADPAQAAKLVELNDLYEATFPGLMYVVFVNGRSREVIMADMQKRIQAGDIANERKLAITAMCDIALDRVRKLLVSKL